MWNFDDYYRKLKEAGVDVMPCIQGTSKCVVPNLTSRNQKPITENEDSTNPQSYSEHASTMFQYAARYGTKQVGNSKLLLASNQEKVSGLGYIKYFENWNEPDKTWEGEKSHFTPEELAAMCSADYDGHEKTLGDTYGIKNADPDTKLVMGGVANSANLVNYLNGMKEWAENNRTDKQLPFDVINFHMYVGKNSPENSEFENRCKEIVSWRNENAIDKEVWLTEFGWDSNSNSQLGAPSKQAQRDWLVRTYLIANASGIERSTMYMSRDTGGENQTGKYATSGLTTQKGEWNKKPAWYGVYTLKNTLKGFKFKEIVQQNENIYIYKFYNEETDEDCYVLWSPTEDGSKIDNYSLNIEKRAKAQLTVLKDDSETGEQTNLDIQNQSVSVNVTESPIFVKVGGQIEEIIIKQLYTKPSVAQIGVAGTNRGNWHDRQNLGIYMKAGASFEIRQTNLSINTDLTLDCLNNDSQTEKSYTIPKNGEWVTIKVDNDSVPFIRTIYKLQTDPTVEIRNLQGTEKLTYYFYKDNEKEFLENWRNNNHSYAVIENDVATFLVPIKDRESIVKKNGNNYNFKSIDEMLEYYKEFVEQFDRFIGLSYDTENPLHKNIRTKFFVKANKHGAGAAYYSGNHTAQNGDSMSAYLCKGWLNIHEFGHGYEGSLALQDLQLVDVMNNILAHYYQITFLNENDGGWLGKKINIEENMKNAREKALSFNGLGYREKLYMFVNLLDKIGPEKSMGYVHSKYREYLSQGIQYNGSDMFSKSFSEVSGYNVIPYLNSYKIMPSEDILAEIYEQELPMIYYLKDLVESDEKAETIRQELGLDGKYALVSNKDIAKYNMKGNLSIKISIDDFELIKGKKIYIKDGKNLVKEITIDSQNIKVEGLPAGIYTLQLPNAKNNAYMHNYEYVTIRENTQNEKNIEYKKIKINTLASDTQISFRGLGDSEFAKLKIDLENNELNLISNNMQPHVYFTDEYANVQIFDKYGNLLYEKSYIGNVASPSNDKIDIDLGYTITIKHREAAARLIFKSKMLNINEEFKNLNNNQTTYTITKYGLQKEGTSDEEQYQLYKRKLNKYIENLKENIPEAKQENSYSYFMYKNKLLSNILDLNEEDKKTYIEENKKLINWEELNKEPVPEPEPAEELYCKSNEYKIENEYISKIEKEKTKKEFVKTLKTNGAIKILKQDGKELNENEFVGTGMILEITKNDEKIQLTIAIMGDLSGDGKVTAQDLSTINKCILGILELENQHKKAADLDENDKLTVTDLSEVNKMILGIKY